jgi:hypothetical protein
MAAIYFPNEILTEILRAVPQSDQTALCRVSKLFHALCLPILYRVVHLKDLKSIDSFCSSVLSNATARESLRSFKVGYIAGIRRVMICRIL